MNRQRLILFVLVIVFAVASFWSYWAMPRPKTVALTFKPGQQPKAAGGAADKTVQGTDDGARLKIDLLEKEQTGFKGYRRNLFKPLFSDERMTVKQKAVVIKPMPPVPAPKVSPTVEPVLVLPEAAALARFTFLGFLKKGSVKTIFLAKDKDILLVKKGDTVAGRYEATEVTDQALTLTVLDSGTEIVIPLVENRPLAAAK